MTHSTFAVSDFQYLRAFHALLPTRLLKQAVSATAAVAKRNRHLPAHLVLGTLVVWFFHAKAKLPFIAGWLCGRPKDLPSASAVYQARERLGWQPLRWLCRRVLRPLAELALDPLAFYDGRRLLAIDGTSFTVADTPANERAFGRAGNQHGRSGYPLMRLVAVCEVGTHALLHWITRSFRVGEQTLAARRWQYIPAGALLLGDRNFHCYPLWEAARTGCWNLLIRVQAGPKFAVAEVLGDGSFLSWVYPRRGKGKKSRAIRVRVITYTWTDEKGQLHTSRLLTSLLDAVRHPARVLVDLYHRRWEQEGVFREIKLALQDRGTQVRAQDPLRALQELDGLLLGHFVVRWVILQAAREKGVAPIDISFTGTLRILQTRLGAIPESARERRSWWRKLKEAIGREQLQKRRQRSCPRKKKVTRSAWPVKRKGDEEHFIPTLDIVWQTGP
jgi:Transposase DDE domain/Insertion element 4 transposase N-terminal